MPRTSSPISRPLWIPCNQHCPHSKLPARGPGRNPAGASGDSAGSGPGNSDRDSADRMPQRKRGKHPACPRSSGAGSGRLAGTSPAADCAGVPVSGTGTAGVGVSAAGRNAEGALSGAVFLVNALWQNAEQPGSRRSNPRFSQSIKRDLPTKGRCHRKTRRLRADRVLKRCRQRRQIFL